MQENRVQKNLGTYLVFGSSNLKEFTLSEFISSVVESGIDVIQLREKDINGNSIESGEFFENAKIVSETISKSERANQIKFIINDQVAVALALYNEGFKIDGVHLGQSDLQPKIVRELFDKIGFENAIIGLSCRTEEALENAAKLYGKIINYVGVGPLHSTLSKPNIPSGFEFEKWGELCKFVKEKNPNLPVLAIGGITPKDAKELKKLNADGYCCISFITNSKNPKQQAEEFANAWKVN